MTSYQEHNHFANTTTGDNLPSYCQPSAEKQRINYILDGSDEVIFQNNKLPELKTQQQSQQKQLSFITYEPSLNTNTNSINHHNSLVQRLPSPFDEESEQQDQSKYYNTDNSMPPPSATEMQYIKRIHTLMTLVAKQTKEIHNLREVIASLNKDGTSLNDNRKRNKLF